MAAEKFLSDKDVTKYQRRGDVVTIDGRLFIAVEAVEEHAAPAAEKPGSKKTNAEGS